MTRRTLALSTLFLMTILVCPGVEFSKSQTTRVSVYSLRPNEPIYLKTPEGVSTRLKTYSGSVSDWVEVASPFTLTDEENTKLTADWFPSDPTIKDWFLILSAADEESQSVAVTTIPGTNSEFPQATLIIVNTTEDELFGKCNGKQFTVDAGGYTKIESKQGTLSIEAKTSNSPQLSCKVSVSDINPNGRSLFVIGAPYIKGSAELKHRLLRIPERLSPPSQPESSAL